MFVTRSLLQGDREENSHLEALLQKNVNTSMFVNTQFENFSCKFIEMFNLTKNYS